MIAITTYDATGRLVSKKLVPEVTDDVSNEGFFVYGIYEPADYYVKDGQITLRPPNPTNILDTTLFNIPMPSYIRIGEDRYPVTDSTMEIEFPLPGSYEVIVLSFPQREKTFRMVKT